MRIFAILSLLFITSTGWAQQSVATYTFDKGVKGITFDSIELVHYAPQADGGIRTYLFMKRTGAVQAKTGSLYSGGKEQIWLEALGVVDLSKDMKVVKEELTFVKPKGTGKEFNILAENDPVRAETIATHEDCTDKWGLLDKYPDLKNMEEGPTQVLPKMYYNNRLSYSMLGLKPKGFDKAVYTLKTEESEAEKSFLSRVLSEGNYDRKSESVDFDPYRNSDKKDYWIQASEDVCAPKTGMVYAHHGHIIWGEKGNKTNEFEQEFVVFDKEGKETSRTLIQFEQPHALELRQALLTETPEDNLYDIDGFVHVYKQNYGFGYKKLNPEPDKQAYQFFQWNAAGEPAGQTTFQVPVENVNILRAFHTGDKVSLLGASYKPEAFYTFCFEGENQTCSETLDAGHPLAKGLGFSPSELARYTWKYHYSYLQPDASRLFIYRIDHEVSTSTPGSLPTTTVTPKGFVLMRTDQSGKLTHAQHFMRPANADATYKSALTSYPDANGNYLLIVKDPLQGGTSAITAYRISGASLELKKIAEMNDARELEVKQSAKANNLLFFSRNANDQLYQLLLVSL